MRKAGWVAAGPRPGTAVPVSFRRMAKTHRRCKPVRGAPPGESDAGGGRPPLRGPVSDTAELSAAGPVLPENCRSLLAPRAFFRARKSGSKDSPA